MTLTNLISLLRMGFGGFKKPQFGRREVPAVPVMAESIPNSPSEEWYQSQYDQLCRADETSFLCSSLRSLLDSLIDPQPDEAARITQLERDILMILKERQQR